ncbi:hypothetical protein VNO78_02714 [Psophocarpus tetragonolobus]|uniref:Uncharacterized protein n=1 Tax=Psophocarpus tetragonolobus TaxID=3891 RepID=A0AAN9TB51_PSOTE
MRKSEGEGRAGEEAWSVIQRYGQIKEVVIPNKTDKRGQRFDFVPYLRGGDEDDPEVMDQRLRDVENVFLDAGLKEETCSSKANSSVKSSFVAAMVRSSEVDISPNMPRFNWK